MNHGQPKRPPRKNSSGTSNHDKKRRRGEGSGHQQKKKKIVSSTGSEERELDNESVSASPVAVYNVDHDDDGKKVLQLTLNSKLDDYLYPLTKEEFLSKYLRKRAVHITTTTKSATKSHPERRVSQLCKEMFDLNVEQILRETSSDNVFVWLLPKDKKVQDDDNTSNNLIQSIELDNVDTAIALYKIGHHATYCRAPPKVEQTLVAQFLRDTGLGCGQYDPSGENPTCLGRGEVETFISTDGHITNWHYDFQENFTIQLSGIKRWYLQHSTIQDPLRGCTPHYAAPDAVESQLKSANLYQPLNKFQFGNPQVGVNAIGNIQTIDVKPGDVFYFPAGMWHKVETIEPGVSINVSLMATNYATLTCQSLQHYLLNADPKWRMPVINNPNASVVDHLKTLLKELPDMIRKLERNGQGAESIIPPILRYPPNFQQVDNDLEDNEGWEDVEQVSGGDDEDRASEDELVEDDEEEKKADNDAQAMNEREDESEEEDTETDVGMGVIDPWEFDDYPDGWDFSLDDDGNNNKKEYQFKRNSLAMMHKLSDYTRFYNKKNGNTRNRDDDRTFVLNVNFAGNEMHQSAIRKVFRDKNTRDGGILDHIYQQEKSGNDDVISIPYREDVFPVIKCLVFHGYLLNPN